MGTDQTAFKLGGVQVPLPTGTGNALLQDADPALFYTLDFLASMIDTLIGARLVSAATSCGAPIAQSVATALPIDPEPYLQTAQYQFPLLAVFRRSEKYEMRTATKWHRSAEFGVVYALPPLTAAQAEQVTPILYSLSGALLAATEQGYYPTYTPPGGTLGQQVLAIAGIEQWSLTSGAYGNMPHINGLFFPTWVATMNVQELRGKTTGFDVLAAADVEEDLADPSGTLNNVVNFKSDDGQP